MAALVADAGADVNSKSVSCRLLRGSVAIAVPPVHSPPPFSPPPQHVSTRPLATVTVGCFTLKG